VTYQHLAMHSTMPVVYKQERFLATEALFSNESTMVGLITLCNTMHGIQGISTMHNIMHKMRLTHDTDKRVTMYMSEMLIRDQHSQRLKQPARPGGPPGFRATPTSSACSSGHGASCARSTTGPRNSA